MDAFLIPLSGKHGAGRFAIVDEEDAERISGHSWHVRRGGYPVAAFWDGKRAFSMSMHSVILGTTHEVDHKNGNVLDNRKGNLRLATRSQNCANRCGWSSLGLKGVKRQKNGRFTAVIQVNKRAMSFGTYDTPEQAGLAYDRAAMEHFGEFARLNFPTP